MNRRRKAVDANDIAAIYELSFWAHFELVTIHPWADGNGRTCRLLMNLLQMEFDVLPTKVLKEDNAEYIQALSAPAHRVWLFGGSWCQQEPNIQQEIKRNRRKTTVWPVCRHEGGCVAGNNIWFVVILVPSAFSSRLFCNLRSNRAIVLYIVFERITLQSSFTYHSTI
jgi:hypothetical protein